MEKIVESIVKYLNNEEEIYWVVANGGKYRCDSIKYHKPMGEGDAHYCDIYKDGNLIQRVFRPDLINFKREEQ